MRIRKSTNNGRPCWVLELGVVAGRRRRQFYQRKADAEAAMQAEQARKQDAGDVWLALNARERLEVAGVLRQMREAGASLREVWREWQAAQAVHRAPVPVEVVIGQLVVAKRAANRRERYVTELEGYLRAFVRGRGQMGIAEFSSVDVEQWLSKDKAASTRRGNFGRLSALFSFALRKGYVVKSPCASVERVTVEARPPVILTVRQCAKVMVFVRRHLPRGLAWFTLALFAGVRPEELDRMGWDAVDFKAETLRVDAEASKVRRRRLVHLMPAALAWLYESNIIGSELPLPRATRRRYLRRVRDALGFTRWPQDVLRHTAASMLVAHWQDAGRVALELGNSPAVLLRDYRELVDRPTATRFWSLTLRKPLIGAVRRTDKV